MDVLEISMDLRVYTGSIHCNEILSAAPGSMLSLKLSSQFLLKAVSHKALLLQQQDISQEI